MTMIETGRLEEARSAIEAIPDTGDSRTERLFLEGYLLERSYDSAGAARKYEEVLSVDPDHTEAAFRLALIADQAGDEETALSCFERCASREEVPVHALINLALMYEERGQLERAERCLNEVLKVHPNHERAKRFLRSVKCSYTMFYDEQSQWERERRDAVLDMPIADFELSVRARNCLKQMNIRTLGDLLKTTEYELLSYRNFGETSLNEIKAMLAQKGLRLGQALQAGPPSPPAAIAPRVNPEAMAAANKHVSELELSVRSRKALQRLGVTTLGELAMRTEAELLSIKNFGQTSLNEIKEQLAKFGLSFRKPGTS